jgi:hypothetical protein
MLAAGNFDGFRAIVGFNNKVTKALQLEPH